MTLPLWGAGRPIGSEKLSPLSRLRSFALQNPSEGPALAADPEKAQAELGGPGYGGGKSFGRFG